MKGRLIVLEGIDGSGKTTQINHLAEWLPTSGLIPDHAKLHLTREPGGTPLGLSIRRLLLESYKGQYPDPLTELLLYAADRAQHVNELILPALMKGDWVLCDRFIGSTIAYQGYGRNLDLNIIDKLESIATKGLIPDITFWLDIPVKTSLERRINKKEDRMEAEGEIFLNKVAKGFDFLCKTRNWIRINGELEVGKIYKEIEFELQEKSKLLR